MDCEMMFQLTESAHKKLLNTVMNEKKTIDEQLFIRLSMGIG
jgi:hypothetical protein